MVTVRGLYEESESRFFLGAGCEDLPVYGEKVQFDSIVPSPVRWRTRMRALRALRLQETPGSFFLPYCSASTSNLLIRTRLWRQIGPPHPKPPPNRTDSLNVKQNSSHQLLPFSIHWCYDRLNVISARGEDGKLCAKVRCYQLWTPSIRLIIAFEVSPDPYPLAKCIRAQVVMGVGARLQRLKRQHPACGDSRETGRRDIAG
ncbi:hypothetical protein BJX64DRAFT_257326 [Aspergillus heterothallicus]